MNYILLLICILLLGCNSNSNSGNTFNDGNVNANNTSDTCECNLLVADSSGLYVLNDNYYTGVCVSYYPNTKTTYIEKHYLGGKLHGKVTYFDKNGKSLFQEMYESGKQKRSGNLDHTLSCDCSELNYEKISGSSGPIARLDDIPFTGKCTKYYEGTKQLYMESNYKNGKLDGYTIYYKRDGSTILMETYNSGELIKSTN